MNNRQMALRFHFPIFMDTLAVGEKSKQHVLQSNVKLPKLIRSNQIYFILLPVPADMVGIFTDHSPR